MARSGTRPPRWSPAPRDAYEIALVKAAIGRDLPMFAICRGIQLLNVALGGSLVQDIPTEVLQHLDHHPDVAAPR